MKKLCVWALLIALPWSAFSQAPNPDLDTHRSFKHIKLGDHIMNYPEAELLGKTPKLFCYLMPPEKELSSLFNFSIDSVLLWTRQDTVVKIELTTDYLQYYSKVTDGTSAYFNGLRFLRDLADKMKVLFGPPTSMRSTRIGIHDFMEFQWSGNHTLLSVCYGWFDLTKGDLMKIYIVDLDYLLLTTYSDGF